MKKISILLVVLVLVFSTRTFSIIIQENTTGFCSVDGLIVTNVTGYTGTGFADGDRGIGKSINWSISVPSDGTISVSWRYANGGGSGDRKCQVLVDGVEVKDTLNFRHTGTWTNWKMSDTLSLNLTTGKHNVRLISYSVDGLANLDYIYADGNNVAVATCLPSYSLQVLKNNDNGTVWYEPVLPFYDQGTMVTLHAKAKPGYFFQSWSGDATSTDTAYTFSMKKNVVTTAMFLANGTTMDPEIIGFATVQDDHGTPFLVTGGKGGKVVEATTLDELKTYLGSDEPMVVQLGRKITGASVLSVKSNKTFIGITDSAHLEGIQVDINNGAKNVIIQHLTISKVIAAAGIGDAISINGKARNIWIDHCNLYADKDHDKDYYDGLIDIKNEASFITISWNLIHDHYKVNLVTSNDQSPQDSVIRITYHHNYFYNCGSRLPSVRFGKAHVFNNYYKNDGDAISSRMGACIRVEENYFENVGTAVMTDQSIATGNVEILDNYFGSASVAATPTCILPVPYSYQSSMIDKMNVPTTVGKLLTAIKEEANPMTAITTFPNPANDKVFISFDLIISADVGLSIHDLSGRVLYEVRDNLKSGINEVEVPLANIQNGLYFYTIHSTGYKVTKKLLVVH